MCCACFYYLGNGVDDLLVVILTVDHTLLLQRAKVSHDLTLHSLQRKATGGGEGGRKEEIILMNGGYKHLYHTIRYSLTATPSIPWQSNAVGYYTHKSQTELSPNYIHD